MFQDCRKSTKKSNLYPGLPNIFFPWCLTSENVSIISLGFVFHNLVHFFLKSIGKFCFSLFWNMNVGLRQLFFIWYRAKEEVKIIYQYLMSYIWKEKSGLIIHQIWWVHVTSWQREMINLFISMYLFFSCYLPDIVLFL